MTKAKPKRQVFCVDCNQVCGWTEGRGRRRLRCYQCYIDHMRAYNAQAKRKERLKKKIDSEC